MADKNQDTPRAPAMERAAPVQQAPALNPLEMPDKGQRMSDGERRRAEAEARLIETRRKADEDRQAAEIRVRAEHRATVGAEIDERRQAALAEHEAGVSAYREAHRNAQPLAVDPGTLAIMGAMEQAKAAALEMDETVPGGEYVVNGRRVDADGNALE